MMHHFAPPRTSPRDDWIVDPKRGRNPTRPSPPCVTESIFVLYEVAERDAGSRRSRKSPVLRQNLGRRQVVDLSALIRRESRLDDHPLAPPASTLPRRRGAGHRCRAPGGMWYSAAAGDRGGWARDGTGGRPRDAVAGGGGDPRRRRSHRGRRHHGRRRPWGSPCAPRRQNHRLLGRDGTAGFWNSHVHFTGADFRAADTAPAESLAAALRAMLTSYGVVHVVDTGSSLPNTLALRRRIESGEVPGPSILTAGSGFAPAGGSPYYILPARIPELTRPEDAVLVDAELARGGDIVKLFTGSWATPSSIVVMPVDVVRAAVEVGHRRRKLVFAHPSNSPGARAAIEGGVDVLAHTFPTSLDGSPWDRALPAMMKERGMALIPTLKLWPYELKREGLPAELVELVLGNGVAQTRAFAELRG